MFELRKNVIDYETYLDLRRQVGWISLTEEQAKTALDNSLITVMAVEDGQPVGMGRVVGDKAVISYVQDLIVVPKAQGKGVGSMILQELIKYVESVTMPETRMMLCLMCAKGREKFYEKHNFIARPTPELGPGMIQYIKKM